MSADGSDFWVCRYCGNVLLRGDRPTRCFNCRSGHSTDELAASEREAVYRRLDEEEREVLLFA